MGSFVKGTVYEPGFQNVAALFELFVTVEGLRRTRREEIDGREDGVDACARVLVVVLCLAAFGFAIAVKRFRRTVSIPHPHPICVAFTTWIVGALLLRVGNILIQPPISPTYSVYDSDVAAGYGVGALLFLLSSQSLLMEVTTCMCFGQPLAPDGNRAWSIIYFTFSWLAFLISEACLFAGATKNAYHTKYRHVVHH